MEVAISATHSSEFIDVQRDVTVLEMWNADTELSTQRTSLRRLRDRAPSLQESATSRPPSSFLERNQRACNTPNMTKDLSF